jgi:hypothetical protein
MSLKLQTAKTTHFIPGGCNFICTGNIPSNMKFLLLLFLISTTIFLKTNARICQYYNPNDRFRWHRSRFDSDPLVCAKEDDGCLEIRHESTLVFRVSIFLFNFVDFFVILGLCCVRNG